MQTTIWKWRFHWFLCISLRCARFWHGSLPQHLWAYEKHRAQNSFILAPSAYKKNIQKQTNVVKYILIREKKKCSSILLNRCRVQLVPFTDNLYSCANYINLVDGRKKKKTHTQSSQHGEWGESTVERKMERVTELEEQKMYIIFSTDFENPTNLIMRNWDPFVLSFNFCLHIFFVLFSSHRYYRTTTATETVQ